jgi:hypothetical protein
MTTLRIAAAVALTGLAATATPAAASIADGTSNTLQVGVTSSTLVTPSSSYTFENVMVESLSGTMRPVSPGATRP